MNIESTELLYYRMYTRLLVLFSVLFISSCDFPSPPPPGTAGTTTVEVVQIHDPWNPWAEKDATELAREFASRIVSIKITPPVVAIRSVRYSLHPYRVNYNLISCTVSADINYIIAADASPGDYWLSVRFYDVNGNRMGKEGATLVRVGKPDKTRMIPSYD